MYGVKYIDLVSLAPNQVSGNVTNAKQNAGAALRSTAKGAGVEGMKVTVLGDKVSVRSLAKITEFLKD